ncbi:MAG: hypothetical protein BA872_04230 [Desulfobacterales bacterium C00003060]|nr:MAG: hypothetical protein BA872_04230 [Desulfobacterales bacterium C00003060]
MVHPSFQGNAIPSIPVVSGIKFCVTTVGAGMALLEILATTTEKELVQQGLDLYERAFTG